MVEKSRRFLRTEALLGEAGMQKLQRVEVMIIGLGAVGGYCVEALARVGIGRLTLVDFDTVDESNINRQILALTSTVGAKKTELARRRVLDINPDCNVTVKDMFVNGETLPQLFETTPDYVIDAIDALNPKCCLIEELCRRGIPFVSSMGAALKSDASCIKYGRLSATRNCALAKFIRKRLKKRGLDLSKIYCVSSDEQVNLPETAVFMEDNPGQESGRQRHTLGSLPTITAIFGLTIANAVIKSIVSKE